MKPVGLQALSAIIAAATNEARQKPRLRVVGTA
jgi:hypothetical protein